MAAITVLETVCQKAEQLVAFFVSKKGVDQLEPVDVHPKESEPHVGIRIQHLPRGLEKLDFVVDSRQRVKLGQILQLVKRGKLAALDRVAKPELDDIAIVWFGNKVPRAQLQRIHL